MEKEIRKVVSLSGLKELKKSDFNKMKEWKLIHGKINSKLD